MERFSLLTVAFVFVAGFFLGYLCDTLEHIVARFLERHE